MFESSVISYGNQRRMGGIAVRSWFESSVNSYGNQTANVLEPCKIKFESSVSYRYDKR